MRISVLQGDPGYLGDAASGRYTAFLDGKKLERCVTADEEKGMALVYSADSNGRIITDATGTPAKEWRFGKVEIKDAIAA